jgi:hypothetical protein
MKDQRQFVHQREALGQRAATELAEEVGRS